MKKAIGAALAAVLLATSMVSSAATAAPRRDQERFMQNYCGRHNDNDCRDWNRHRDRWDNHRYQTWYQRHRHENDFQGAAALFGFVAGAAAGAIAGSVNGSHVAACEARYRSYDPGSNTYLGFDGYRHECRL